MLGVFKLWLGIESLLGGQVFGWGVQCKPERRVLDGASSVDAFPFFGQKFLGWLDTKK